MIDSINKLTIKDLLLRANSDRIAIQSTSPSNKFITYGNLIKIINKTRIVLCALDIGSDRPYTNIALVIKDGPKMASMFLAIASNPLCVACPLNPSYTKDEFIFYFRDLNIKTVITEKNTSESLLLAAKEAAVNVLYLDDITGEIIFDGRVDAESCEPQQDKYAMMAENFSDNDIALILHTSGTTTRPKMVPLTHKNLIASAHNISQTLNLESVDKCLNIMPLFHIHGLVAGLLAVLYQSGTSIIPNSGFNALSFFKWLDETKPSWYTAVPTMHQIILSRADRNKEIIDSNPLRFIRSSSASLPKSVMKNLEKTFNTAVIESYGMTEAAHQMTSNPLPPLIRKSGSVGIPAGPEVKIMSNKTILGKDKKEIRGQIIIKGKNVTQGYLNNEAANSENYFNGWFLTGDEGYFDKDGYLIISGRLKEIINRGGEKISPLEVDEVLTRHEHVLQVVTFSIPHLKLGEDIAAVVVLKKDINSNIDEKDLKNFCKNKLADFKIPNKIIFLEEIPKGATGKIQRIGMAKKLGLE